MEDVIFNIGREKTEYSLTDLLDDNFKDFIDKDVTCYRCKCRNHDCRGQNIYNVVARHATFIEFKRFLQQAIK